jgi:hypothetical protein
MNMRDPLSNIQEIVNDVIKKGFTSVKPIYNMSGEYHFIHNISCSVETKVFIRNVVNQYNSEQECYSYIFPIV